MVRSGGHEPRIIHIAGLWGSGKSYLGQKLTEKGYDVYDLDDLNLIRGWYYHTIESHPNYASLIDYCISEYCKDTDFKLRKIIESAKKDVIFVGVGDIEHAGKRFLPSVLQNADVKFFLNTDAITNTTNRFDRDIAATICADYEDFYNKFIENKSIVLPVNLHSVSHDLRIQKADYKAWEYKVATQEAVLKYLSA